MADFLNLDILFEDNHLIVLNKPAGILVQGDITGKKTLLQEAKEYIKVKYQKAGNVFLAIVHRLDRPVSGVIVFARNSKSAGRLSEAFRERKVEKIYLALVKGIFREKRGILKDYIYWNEPERKAKIVSEGSLGKEAVTFYEVIDEDKNISLVKLVPHTGRKHQLRVQLSKIGHPILGDEKYGGGKIFKDKIFLHCYKLTLPHPVKKENMEFKAKVPDFWKDFWRYDINDKEIPSPL